ncbi:Hypothetical predicted protein [Podarcis lilfordi]|uniref:Uncharacterized protein n=1 Tax=Podarcis lilfordi TaxID=74358 RepID=A0AA35KBN2_9SAUR|nr:Hypothetical predicted protein [Podarcis lilfordi]
MARAILYIVMHKRLSKASPSTCPSPPLAIQGFCFQVLQYSRQQVLNQDGKKTLCSST